jgi:hypothetical protein
VGVNCDEFDVEELELGDEHRNPCGMTRALAAAGAKVKVAANQDDKGPSVDDGGPSVRDEWKGKRVDGRCVGRDD